MGLFAGMQDAKISEGGVYISEGLYKDIEVLALKTVVTRKKENVFIAELKIIESEGPLAIKPGIECAWVANAKHDSFLGNVKALLKACAEELGQAVVDVKDISEADADVAVSEDQPFAGVHLSAQAVNIKTRSGGDFTKVTWSPKTFVSGAKTKAA